MKIGVVRRASVALLVVTSIGHAQLRPEAGPAQIVIDTVPEARVFVDNVLKGTASPAGRLVITEPKEGMHKIRIEKAGKEAYSTMITVRRGKTTAVRSELKNRPGVLEILTEPNADIFLDDKPVGVTDRSGRVIVRDVAAQEHTLRVVAEGFNPFERVLIVSPGSQISMNAPLRAFRAGPVGLSQRAPRYVLQRRLVAYQEGVQGMAFVSGSDELVSWGEIDGALVWDRRTGKQLRKLEIREARTSVAYFAVSPNLQWLAVRLLGASHPTRLVDTRTGRIARVLNGFGYPRAFTPDSKRMVLGAHMGYTNGGPDDEAALVEVDTGRVIKSWKDWSMRAFAVSPNGKWIAGGDDYVTLWDAETGEQVRRIEAKAHALAFSSDSKYIAIGDEKRVELWETPPGAQGRTLTAPKLDSGGSLEFGSLAFVPNSPYLLAIMTLPSSIRTNSSKPLMYVWDLQTGKAVNNWELQDGARIALSDDGQWMALAGNELTIWRRE